MQVSEAFTAGRGPGANLDRWVVTDDFAAVLDGTTPKGPDREEATAATAAMVDDLVCTVRGLDPESTVAAVVDALAGTAARHQEPFAPSAAGAVYAHRQGVVVVLSDVWVAVDGQAQFFPHRYEQLLAQVRVAVTERALAAGRPLAEVRRDDPGRAAIADLLAGESQLRNVDAPGGYFFAALDGQPVPARLTHVVSVPDTARRLVLASDGYPRLGRTLEESESLLEAVVREDPLMVRLAPGTKAVPDGSTGYDDRTYLSLDL